MMSNQVQYKGARFYKCALQVNSYRYNSDFRGGELYDENTYNQEIFQHCSSNKITVVALAGHGSVEHSKTLRTYLTEKKIIVFPGFEIASSEKIHMVCLYSENRTNEEINQFLGQLMGGNSSRLREQPTHPSSLSCEQIAGKVLNEQEGFWYAAHVTGKSGLLRLSGAGDNYAHLWRKDDLVVAVQIPGSLENVNIDNQNLEKYRKILNNQNSDYKREKSIAIINAKDVCDPEQLSNPSASCRIKMTNANFQAFKDAFKDPQSRVRLNHQIPERPYSFIESIRWQGAGFFEDTAIFLSKHLNAVIGGRGTGKSTLIESIRYALNLDPRQSDTRGLDAFHAQTLSNSQIIIKIYSKAQQGNCYTISRRYGEAPVVQNEQGVSHLTPREILPDIELLGQNEILEIEKNEDAKLSLINNFLPDGSEFESDLTKIKRMLSTNRDKLIRAHNDFEKLDEAVSLENKLKERAEQFNKLGITDKLKNTQLIEKEKVIQEKIKEQFNLIKKWINNYQEIFELSFLKNGNIQQLPNIERIMESKKIFEDLQKILNKLIKEANKELHSAKDRYQAIQLSWQDASDKIRDALNQAIAQLPEQAGKSGKELGAEYTTIIKRLTLIEKEKQTHKNQKKLVDEIESERKNLLEDYRNTAFNHYITMDESVKKLNKGTLKGKVKIKVMRYGNIKALKDFLCSIDGIGPAKIQWLDSNGIQLDLVQWSQWIKEQNTNAFMDEYSQYGLTLGIAKKITSINLSKRLELEEIELKDKIDIELNTAHGENDARYVSLGNLSTGQKCTAILNLLLLNCDDPLIIDQPEDNLDNAFIAERIVQDLRQSKTKRQFLFATHNANIPVFGDAELIVVLDSNKDNGFVKNIGSVDKLDVGKQAAEILEGGKAAFNARKRKYGF